MYFSAVEKPFSSLISLSFIILVSMIVASMISMSLYNLSGISIQEVLEGEDLNSQKRILLRLGLIISHAGTFLIPAYIFLKFFVRTNRIKFLRLSQPLPIGSFVLWGLVILFSYPLIGALAKWNMTWPFPEWMKSSQSDSLALIEQTLQMQSVSELFLSILLVGILAALGEELIFRGIIQEFLERAWNNPHLAIIVSAFIFGGFHMQFERFLPLSFLGILLGYSYYYTRSLLVPLLLHFINNSIQVFSIYIISKNGTFPEIDKIPDIPISYVVTSVMITILLTFLAIKQSSIYHETRS